MKCNYCWNNCNWVENKEIYWKNYWKSYMIYLCKKCDAYVWCHNNTKTPLWILANKELRELRKKSKTLFIEKELWWNWNCGKKLKDKWYLKLKEIFWKEFHFWESSIEECLKLIEIYK